MADDIYCPTREPDEFDDWDEEDPDTKEGEIYQAVTEWRRRGRRF